MNNPNKHTPLLGLTATEVSSLWASFLMNSSQQRLLEYFFASTDDGKIKQIIERMLTQSKENIKVIEELFRKENLNVPHGFTEEDVKVDSPKVFSDTFVLNFCFDFTHLYMSTYPIALSDCTRNDVREHFQENIGFSVKIQDEIVKLMISEGVYVKPPQIAIDSEVEIVENFMYFNGYFGGSRPLNAPEIANLSRIIHRAQFSKMVFVTFSKLAKTKDLKHHFSKGRDGIEKVLTTLQEILDKENIPISASGEYQISNVEISPFSDKLMLFFVNTCLGILCFAMISQAMTSSLRTDIVAKLSKISDDMKKFYSMGLLLALKEKWIEQPPQAVDRKV